MNAVPIHPITSTIKLFSPTTLHCLYNPIQFLFASETGVMINLDWSITFDWSTQKYTITWSRDTVSFSKPYIVRHGFIDDLFEIGNDKNSMTTLNWKKNSNLNASSLSDTLAKIEQLGAPQMVCIQLQNNFSVSPSSTTRTLITFTENDILYDPSGMWGGSSAPGIFTIPDDGLYKITISANWSNATGTVNTTRQTLLLSMADSAPELTIAQSNDTILVRTNTYPSGASTVHNTQTCIAVKTISGGQKVYFAALQNHNSETLSLLALEGTHFEIQRVA